MMKSKKSFKDLAKQISALQEDQLGKLKGGFSSFSVETEKAKVGNNNLKFRTSQSLYFSRKIRQKKQHYTCLLH